MKENMVEDDKYTIKPLIYYAHSKRIYNTNREIEELNWLLDKFDDVICPNNHVGELGSMEPYLKKVSECKGLILSEYKNHIGKGVFEEVELALSENKLVQCIRKQFGKFYLVKVLKVDIIDKYDWSVYYGKLII